MMRPRNETAPQHDDVDVKPKDVNFHTAVSIAAGFILSLSVVLSMVALRRRNRKNAIAKLAASRFRGFEEDDDGRTYDGFVSFASSDSDIQFLRGRLIPKLEGQHGFKLCVHQRDFVVGLPIADNIMSAVSLSRRTLLVISQAHLASDWCKFEYQMAVQEMMAHKHRVLPILLGDMDTLRRHMDGNMRRLLQYVTWLEYPGNEADQRKLDSFWAKLVLSMPKKRPRNQDEGHKTTDLQRHKTGRAAANVVVMVNVNG